MIRALIFATFALLAFPAAAQTEHIVTGAKPLEQKGLGERLSPPLGRHPPRRWQAMGVNSCERAP